jgi:RimJ/RimL family protein N-acetyltransferase
MEKIDLEKIQYRTARTTDAVEHFKAVQESYLEAKKFLPAFVGMENWTIPQHEKYLKKFGTIDPAIRNYLFFYEGKVIGAGHLKRSIWDHSGELIYWTRTGWDGVGIGQFIAKTMLNAAGANLGYRYVVIETDHNNIGSKRVAEKLGGFPAMVYGYTDHFGKHSNMVVWVIPTPATKLSLRFDKSYEFNPYSAHMNTVYRFDYEGKMRNYMAHDPKLERPKRES